MNQFIMSLLVVLTTQSLWGEEFTDRESIVTTQKNETVRVLKIKDTVLEDSSSFHRLNKQWQLTGQLGYTVTPVASLGINVGYFIDSNSLVQFEASSGETTFLWYGIKARTAGAHYKRFFGNSFYLNSGVDYRQIILGDINIDYWDTNNTSNDLKITSEIGKVSSIAASVSIGNQWQWQNFTLGCDWFGVMAPFTTFDRKYDSSRLSKEDKREEVDRAWDNVGRVVTFQMLKFYLGASF